MSRHLSPGVAAVMAITAAFYLLMLPTILRHLNPVTGDEPFYIMTAISLVRDRDLDESNNYANRDYEEFYPSDPLPPDWRGWPAFPRTLPPHPAITEQDGLYSKHGLGLSVLIALPYDIGGRTGAALLIVLCAILLAGQMFMLAHEAGASSLVALVVSVGLSVTLPLAPYATLIFPEIPAALLIIYVIRRLSAENNDTLRWLLSGAAIGFLPWLHQRFAVMSIVFTLAILVHLWRTRSVAVGLALAPVATGAVSLLGYNYWLYGQPTQNVEDHAGFNGLTGALNGASGLLLDAQWGLLMAAPVVIFGLAAMPHWYRVHRRRAILAIAAIPPYLIVVAAYLVWWGEWGPPARYLVPIVPLLAGPFGAWLPRATVPQRIVVGVAWGAGLMITLIGYANPQRFYHHPDGVNKLYATIGDRLGIDLAGNLVAFQPYAVDPVRDRLLWVACATALILAVAVWINVESPRPGRRNSNLSTEN